MAVEYDISSLHIIESLGASFKEPGKELMRRLKQKGGKVGGFPIYYHEGYDRKDIIGVLQKIYDDEAKLGLVPILHFEVHGTPTGILLRDGSTLLWGELASVLRAFNIATGFNLLVVFACCDGIHQINALTIHDMCPFSAVVGCEGTIYTSELLDGYDRFYEILINEGRALKAEAELQAAVTKSAGTRFRLFTCERAFAIVEANMTAIDNNPTLRKERITHYRKESDRMRALNANLTPTTEAEVDAILRAAEDKTLHDFFNTFFATKEIPANRDRFNFAAIAGGMRRSG